jgi:predicted DNA-binding transcriptional regulator AlpA
MIRETREKPMAPPRRRGPTSKSGIVAALKAKGVEVGASALEPADDNVALCNAFGISKPTLERWRAERGFPQPDFVIGLRSYTWRRNVMAWVERQPKDHPMKGQRPRVEAPEVA